MPVAGEACLYNCEDYSDLLVFPHTAMCVAATLDAEEEIDFDSDAMDSAAMADWEERHGEAFDDGDDDYGDDDYGEGEDEGWGGW